MARNMEADFEKTVRCGKAVYRGHVPLEKKAAVLRSAGYLVSGTSGLEQKGFS